MRTGRDEARDVIRSANARFAEVPLISPETAQKRVVGL